MLRLEVRRPISWDKLLYTVFVFSAVFQIVRKDGANHKQACTFLVTSRSRGSASLQDQPNAGNVCQRAHAHRHLKADVASHRRTPCRGSARRRYHCEWRSRLRVRPTGRNDPAQAFIGHPNSDFTRRGGPHRPVYERPCSFHPEPHGTSHGFEEEPGIKSSRPVTLASALRRPCGGVLPANRRHNLSQGREVPRPRLGQGRP